MQIHHLRRVWGIPVLLTALILFGLLSALLGTGIWHILSWAALYIPIGILICCIPPWSRAIKGYKQKTWV
jgi:hypothetical protein